MAHSGLIHRYPWGFANGEIDPPTDIILSESGTDPDTWGWTDNGSGVKGTDYEYDTNGSNSRLRDLTTSATSRAYIISDELQSSARVRSFAIVRNLSGTTAGTGGLNLIRIGRVNCWVDASNYAFADIAQDPTSSDWRLTSAGGQTSTSVSKSDTIDVAFLYLTDSYAALYFDGAVAPTATTTSTNQASAPSGVACSLVIAGADGSNWTATLEFSDLILGYGSTT